MFCTIQQQTIRNLKDLCWTILLQDCHVVSLILPPSFSVHPTDTGSETSAEIFPNLAKKIFAVTERRIGCGAADMFYDPAIFFAAPLFCLES